MKVFNFLKLNFCCGFIGKDSPPEPLSVPVFSQKIDQMLAKIVRRTYKDNKAVIMAAPIKKGCFYAIGTRLYHSENPQNISSQSQSKGIELIRQVLRQTWGKVIEAQHGVREGKKAPLLLEEAIFQVDRLQQQLRSALPDDLATEVLKNEKWPLVEVDNYKASSERLVEYMKALIEKSPLDGQQKTEALDNLKGALDARTKAIQETREKNKEKYTFDQLNQNEGGLNFQSTLKVKNSEGTPCVISKSSSEDVRWETSSLAWMNELIGSAFDQMLGCQFGTAASAVLFDKGEFRTAHAFKDTNGMWPASCKINPEVAHLFVLFNLLLKTQDAHRGNILQRQEEGQNIPVPIDLARLLSPDPENSVKGMFRFTSYINWKGLNLPLLSRAKKVMENLNIDEVIQNIRKMFENHPKMDEEAHEILEKKLLHLKANFIMVEESMKQGLSPLEMIALSTFKLSSSHLSKLEYILLKNKNSPTLKTKLKKYILDNCYSGFKNAWVAATEMDDFDEDVFRTRIQKEIVAIRKTNASKAYFNSTALKMFARVRL